jgi:pimeloyl-ACP methyl ester carboxylesterase
LKGELVRAWTEDGLQLQGLYCEPTKSSNLPAVLHIHGASSNFYRSEFLDTLAERLAERGYPFATGNTRGHDIVNKVYTKDPTASRRVGVAYEVFEDCLLDIAAWLNFLQERGHDEVMLLGHSAGAHKVAFYQSETSDKRVRGLVFMSPADQGLGLEAISDQLNGILKSVSDMVDRGQGDYLVQDSLAPYPMSAKSIHSRMTSSKSDIFKFGRPEEPWEVVARLDRPILATMGTVGEFTDRTPGEALASLRAKAVFSPRCDTVVVEGAPHNYRGYSTQVSEVLVDWLRQVFEATSLD